MKNVKKNKIWRRVVQSSALEPFGEENCFWGYTVFERQEMDSDVQTMAPIAKIVRGLGWVGEVGCLHEGKGLTLCSSSVRPFLRKKRIQQVRLNVFQGSFLRCIPKVFGWVCFIFTFLVGPMKGRLTWCFKGFRCSNVNLFFLGKMKR